MNYIDILIIIFIVYSCFQGYKRGFIKTFFDTLGAVIAFFLSREFYHPVEDFLMNNTKLFVKVHKFFESNVSERIVETFDESLHIPVELKNILGNIINTGNTAQADTFSVFVDNISIILIRSISFIITFLVVYALLVLLSNFIDIIFKLPILNLTNRLIGAVTGILKGVFILYIIFALASPLIGFMQDSKFVQNVLNSKSSNIFYENNLILNYLSDEGFYKN